jgi:hypothetical protein
MDPSFGNLDLDEMDDIEIRSVEELVKEWPEVCFSLCRPDLFLA